MRSSANSNRSLLGWIDFSVPRSVSDDTSTNEVRITGDHGRLRRSRPALVSLVIVLCAIFTGTHASASPRPNVVVVMADDIGLGDIGFYHRERTGKKEVVPTPNIDRLIDEGIRFSDAHSASSLCAPTRFSMMTGNFVYRNKTGNGSFSPVGDSCIEPDFTTIARTAKKGGYHTAFFGKWGLGSVWSSRDGDMSKIEMGARYFGFDYAYETPQGLQNWPHAFYENQEWQPLAEDSKLVPISKEQARHSKSGIGDSNWNPELVGPMLAKAATEYITRQTADHPDEPFYLYYCSQAVHIPHTPPAQLDGVKIAGATGDDHGDMILELDVQVGMLVKALKKAGVYENTLFIFTSDNGGLSKGKVIGQKGHDSSNGLTGKKGSCYEGGHRVPFIATWPGVIAPGTNSDVAVVNHDTVATISALAGQELHPSVKDSANLVPLFKGDTRTLARKYMLHKGGKGPTLALREGDWKIVLELDPNWESENRYLDHGPLTPVGLYNFSNTTSEEEKFNLIKNPEYAARIKAMHATYLRLRKSLEPTVEY
ncbi:sulfatase family protein [Pelagicoccus mobilis]|uniref:Arylsulfatase n=1 Tax=Pelagicoccus mobilis TaxID=415221 RepID=A0A934VJN0_9BACT|nr:arylsulfatase [Pelagicoccus mobilis]MBK1875796.1 arylsulfatase [Pelagicoccus mobilis]